MEDNKNGRLVAILGILSLVLVTAGVSLAFFDYAKLGTTENSITLGSIEFLYTEVDKVGAGIKLDNAFPMSDEAGKMQTGSGNVFNFKVTSSTPANEAIPYEVTAKMKSDSTLDKDVVKVYLTKGETEEEILLEKYGSLMQTSRVSENVAVEKTIYTGNVPSNTSNYEETFKLRMWVDSETDFSPVEKNGETIYPYSNKTFTLMVNVYADAKVITQEEIDMENNTKIETITAGDVALTKVIGEDYQYSATLPEGTTSTTLKIKPKNPNSTVAIKKAGSLATEISKVKKVELIAGKNYFDVSILSENKKIEDEYVLMLKVGKEKINTLSSLNVSDCILSPDFNSEITGYTCTVENNVTKVVINATSTSTLSQVTGLGEKELVVGKNNINIVVTAEDGTVKTYTVEVTRKGSTDATLNSLSIDGYSISPVFDSGITEYTLTVPYTTSSITVSAIQNNSGASVIGTGSISLNEGTNKIDITVIAEDGKTEKVYTIMVTKEEEPKEFLNTKILNDNINAGSYYTTTPTLKINNFGKDKGLYKSIATNSGNPTYYFRGNVENDYVDFAGFTWRIIRINEDNTVRIQLEEGINDNTTYYFNFDDNSNSDYSKVDYMYYSNCDAKNLVDTWYLNNIQNKNYSDKIATGNYFCQQAKVRVAYSGSGEVLVGNAVLADSTTYLADFKCTNDANGYGLYNSNVGLVSLDELIHHDTLPANIAPTLNSDKFSWAMSPSGIIHEIINGNESYYQGVWYYKANKNYIGWSMINKWKAIIQPVVNLKADTMATGSGLASDPYKIR